MTVSAVRAAAATRGAARTDTMGGKRELKIVPGQD